MNNKKISILKKVLALIVGIGIIGAGIIYYSQTEWICLEGGRGGVPVKNYTGSKDYLFSGKSCFSLKQKHRMDYDIWVNKGGCRIEIVDENNNIVYSEDFTDRAKKSLYFCDFEPGKYYQTIYAFDENSDVTYSYYLYYNKTNFESFLYRLFGIKYWEL